MGRGRPRKIATSIQLGNIMEAGNSQVAGIRRAEVVDVVIDSMEQWVPLSATKEALKTPNATSPVVMIENAKVNSVAQVRTGGTNQGKNDMHANSNRIQQVGEIVRN
ncbi:hypothetical protein A4A49_18794 [Nicotiana attenuata]|uniref:Uncharacterized protein n=1 Tax=Nicotiana attenuata TaxID=49451 RepID=A0A1J6I8Q5_NICAT|nr:hypothetical protein A4A49_18794 [Nicotiana attenuata]